MESKIDITIDIIKVIYNELTNQDTKGIFVYDDGLLLVKDYLPSGIPCWRQSTQKEKEEFEKEKETKYEI